MDTAQEECTVRLERYRRARGDDRDVFLVVLPGHAAKAFTARTSAILEAHRLAERVLFTFDGILLRRVTRDGCLPDPIARMLRLTLRSTQRRLGRLTHRRYRGRPRASWAPRGTAASAQRSGTGRPLYKVRPVATRDLQSYFGQFLRIPAVMAALPN